jgi:hypothetical protein
MPERSSKRKRPVDINQLAKSIVDDSTDDEPEQTEETEAEARHHAAVVLGRKGGLKGGKVTSGKLSPEERKLKAKKAAEARWERRAPSP